MIEEGIADFEEPFGAVVYFSSQGKADPINGRGKPEIRAFLVTLDETGRQNP